MINKLTIYSDKVPKKLRIALEKVYIRKTRVVIDYGDVQTGRSWELIFDTKGIVRKAAGSGIPILAPRATSNSGTAILVHCILSIKYSNEKGGVEPIYLADIIDPKVKNKKPFDPALDDYLESAENMLNYHACFRSHLPMEA